ncbi:TCP-1/cpn60 family chaperonin, putative [Eimeria tenella]|uniref:T-complex protein 1 subunit gamma n=1 Tax=Eimeria tenella TaxID=5802 RepID=U6KT45_EIMTE|nr:TCP-1/cpn60 family chaperonin, putative [Eimeria tenella]CDJ41292.1 TCP-1/cpn60 family chaperonin, putative [Eimeria tenella]|eukprot:XP_013232042.1 TCP-1/cpn60 family chaperonin, putative [Eimeria tenella]
MLLDPLGGIVITNDGNAILREVDVAHPAAKSMIELSRSQDEETGDGSTSVVVLAGELLQCSVLLLEQQQLHPAVIAQGFLGALEDALGHLRGLARCIDTSQNATLAPLLDSCLATKFASRWNGLLTQIALQAVRKIARKLPSGKLDIDIKQVPLPPLPEALFCTLRAPKAPTKTRNRGPRGPSGGPSGALLGGLLGAPQGAPQGRYAKVEKIPGGDIEESQMLEGIMLNKDVTHPKMRRRIENPVVLLLDCPLEYKKGESQASVEVTRESEWRELLEQEEAEVAAMCRCVVESGANLVFTEKGVSDLAQHFLAKAGVAVVRRVRKTDNNRISRATGATVVSRPEEILKSDLGTRCGLFEVRKIGDEYFTFLLECKEGTACTIVLRGGSKDVLNEVERNLQDALSVARNILLDGKLLPGGGATEMAVAARLLDKAKSLDSLHQYSYRAVASALEVIPRTLAQNCGANVVKVMTDLRASHSRLDSPEAACIGVDGETGEVCDMSKKMVWDCLSVKEQVFKLRCCCASTMCSRGLEKMGKEGPQEKTGPQKTWRPLGMLVTGKLRKQQQQLLQLLLLLLQQQRKEQQLLQERQEELQQKLQQLLQRQGGLQQLLQQQRQRPKMLQQLQQQQQQQQMLQQRCRAFATCPLPCSCADGRK